MEAKGLDYQEVGSCIGGEDTSLVCPRCYSVRVSKDGFRKNRYAVKQRHICWDCGRRFTGVVISITRNISTRHQVCVTRDRAKNLIVANEGKAATGDSSETDVMIRYENHLKKKGRRTSTIKSKVSILKALRNSGAMLYDIDSVKTAIAEKDVSEGRKELYVYAYEDFLQMMGGIWDRPRYKRRRKTIFIPLEKELDELIVATGKKTSILLQLLKETGIRIVEATYLNWDDIDFEACTIDITPAKNGNPRKLNLSRHLLNRFAALRHINNTTDPNRIFGKHTPSLRRVFNIQRNRLAEKLQNPRLGRISFHTFRHWKGTMMIHLGFRLTDVQYLLGHKSLSSTLKYIHISEAHFNERIPKYVCKTAVNKDDAVSLIEEGYEKVDEFDDAHLYRKLKL